MEKKVTRKEMFNGIKATLAENFPAEDVQEYIDFIEKEIGAIDAKAAKEAERRAAKKAEPDDLMDAVLEYLGEEPITAAEIADKLADRFPEVTRNKVTYRLAKAAKEGKAVKNEIKAEGKKYIAYTIA